MRGKILQWQRIRNSRTCGRRDGKFIMAAEKGVINLATNIPKRRCILWLTKYVHKMTLTRKFWNASEHIGCARASFEVNQTK